jgi:hypothetical protein
MYEAGIATAQQNNIDPQVVTMTPETVPEGCYFIGADSGKIYLMVRWVDPAEQKYVLRQWRGEKSTTFPFLQRYAGPDGVNCVDQPLRATGPQPVIVIGPELICDALEPEGQVLAEGVFPFTVPPQETAAEASSDLPPVVAPVEVEAAPEPDPEELETMALAGLERQDEIDEFEDAVEEYNQQAPAGVPPAGPVGPETGGEESLPFVIPAAIVAIEWDPASDSKMDYLRSLARVMRDTGASYSFAEMAAWAVTKGVWPTADLALRNLKALWRDYLKLDPGFQRKAGKIIPPATPEAAETPAPPTMPTRAEAVAETTRGTEFGERIARRRLGLVEPEQADVMVTFAVPLRLLTPEGLALLQAQFGAVGA